MSTGRRRWRYIALGLSAALFVWLGLEDNSVVPVTLFGAGMSGMVAWRVLMDRRPNVWLYSITGALAGFAVTPIVLLLMVIKSGLHSHAAPDYSIAHLAAVLERTHFFALSGLLIGLGAARMNT